MGLRDIAETDLGFILEDGAFGAGWPIQLRDPDGGFTSLTGFSSDISQVIDPETGLAISGREASVALRLSTLYAAGLTIPKAIADTDRTPWMVYFDDINGRPHQFKIRRSAPDRALGVVICYLEALR